MPKAMTNIDTEFLENVTAMALSQKDLCEMLAEEIDQPEPMHLLGDIYHLAKKIRRAAIEHRQHIRESKQ